MIGVKKTPVPIFAASLGMLEPSRGPAKAPDASEAALVSTTPEEPQVTTPQVRNQVCVE